MSEQVLDVPGRLQDGDRRLVIVGNRRVLKNPSFLQTTSGDYVAHSEDGGVSWKVLDLGCVTEDWVKKVYPAYQGQPKVRAGRLSLEPLVKDEDQEEQRTVIRRWS
jgi:hypothetical protein